MKKALCAIFLIGTIAISEIQLQINNQYVEEKNSDSVSDTIDYEYYVAPSIEWYKDTDYKLIFLNEY